MDWDDYKYFTVLADTGSVRAAAKTLGVNASTVSRRLERFESRLGVRLFNRTQAGLQLTADGAEVVEQLERVAQSLSDVEGQLQGRNQSLDTPLRLLVPEFIVHSTLMRDLVSYCAAYPEARLSLIAASRQLDIARREVDVALLVTDAPPLDLIGHALGRMSWGLYRQTGNDADLDWIGCDAAEPSGGVGESMRGRYLSTTPARHAASSVLLRLALVRAGLGIGALPCMLADAFGGLEREPDTPCEEGPMLWLVTHPDLRNTARVQRLNEYLRSAMSQRVELLQGHVTIER